MTRSIKVPLTPDEAQRLLNELEYMARPGQHVTEDVHALIRRLRKSLSDADQGPTISPAVGGLAGRGVPGER